MYAVLAQVPNEKAINIGSPTVGVTVVFTVVSVIAMLIRIELSKSHSREVMPDLGGYSVKSLRAMVVLFTMGGLLVMLLLGDGVFDINDEGERRLRRHALSTIALMNVVPAAMIFRYYHTYLAIHSHFCLQKRAKRLLSSH